MTLQDLRVLLEYNYWARDRLLDAVARLTPEQFTRDLGSSFRSVRDTLAHVLRAEEIWYRRWHGESPTSMPPLDAFEDVEALRRAWLEHEARMRAFVDGLDDAGVDRVVEYRLMNGQAGASPIRQMLQHVVNHGSYHRGQVTTMLRQLGAAPAKSMDLITFYREREASLARWRGR
jgi:uncharacterized damage-inducible protein DinB